MDCILHREALETLYRNLDIFIGEYDRKKILVMFGTNKIAGMIIYYLKKHNIKISGIIDNDVQRQGQEFYGIKIYSPKEYICDKYKDVCVMIASSYQDEMIKQLEGFGCIYSKNIVKIIDLPMLMNEYDFENNQKYRLMSEDDIKQTQLGILKYLKKICAENNLRYFLCGGTLLGAVRHNGFIPWDDDIDVVMELNDLIKLSKILEKDKRYRLISMFDDSGYFDECSLMVDLNTVSYINRFPMQVEAGVSIDIFILSGLPEGKKAIEAMNKAKSIELECYNTLYSKEIHKQTVSKLIDYLNKYTFDESVNVAHVLGRFMYREITKQEYFSEAVQLTFEDEKFSCPCGYKDYLRDIYGNYMELPPVEERKKHHYFKAYYKE